MAGGRCLDEGDLEEPFQVAQSTQPARDICKMAYRSLPLRDAMLSELLRGGGHGGHGGTATGRERDVGQCMVAHSASLCAV